MNDNEYDIDLNNTGSNDSAANGDAPQTGGYAGAGSGGDAQGRGQVPSGVPSFDDKPIGQNGSEPGANDRGGDRPANYYRPNNTYPYGPGGGSDRSSGQTGGAPGGRPYPQNGPYGYNGSPRPQNRQDDYPYAGRSSGSGSPSGGSSYPYGGVPTGGGNKKKENKGVKILIIIICAIVATCLAVAILVRAFSGKNVTPGGKEDAPTTTADEVKNDGSTLRIDETPSIVRSSGSANELSAEEVYLKIKDSSVGIQEYMNGRLYGEGTGIIMSEEDGYTYILTCAHVISESGATIMIQTDDKSEYSADIVGYDKKTDVGVLSVKATGLKVAEFGDYTQCSVGETVYAIGNPGGSEFAGSFTRGMISAIDRPITSSSSSGYTMDCIQHDAAINPGNSGGALVNALGQVIGINSIKIVDEEYEGMGFAIPITVAKEIVDDLIKNGYVANRPALGITYATLSQYPAYAMYASIKGLPNGSIIIAEINPNGALADTDAQVGDIITHVDGKALDTSSVLLDAIHNSRVGDTLELTIERVDFNNNYKSQTITVRATLVEEKLSTSSQPETTTRSGFNFDFGSGWGNPFGN